MMKMTKKIKLAFLTAAVCTALMTGTLYAADGQPTELNGDTVDYNTNSGIIVATGNVVMKQGTSTVTGAQATYNSKTQEGTVTGGVVADKDDMHMTAEIVVTDGKNHMLASGSVIAIKGDKTLTGPRIDYYEDKDYILIEKDGKVTMPDGTFTADRMEGYLKDNRFTGTGHAHLLSPPRELEAGGDQADYYGEESGKVVLTGNAWAIQENNTLKSSRLTIYLADDKTKVEQ
ncbi:MAG: LptA/OstA family protein [Selenomonadaceae bacterium]